MTEKNEKINGVITYHRRTKSGMAVFYPKHDITIKKDEKLVLHTVPSKQDITKGYEKCPIVSYTVCDATVSTEDVVLDSLNYRTTHKPISKADQRIISTAIETINKLEELPLDRKDFDTLSSKVMEDFKKIMDIRLKQKVLDSKWAREKLIKEKEMRNQYVD